ncbi:DmsC/YnfH family molybdoenzyme membrane anchor subunit [Afifella sp. IM 167]|uniref:dimethyl sulfoxide reductase anchor subunit family protein n=1 Tax=Afifella sp. IM 167 TaxID=2033586 RepID=UPI001CCB057F|nr:DmsC/YnfH family molybdoenzyme membrane anchor subunit [Afifella sp. IM 167]MBZ8132044.1 DMSO reductase [Afifella sp. IM 167]
MHPAFSVIFFTTATGAGYGLLALTGIFFAFGAVPEDRLFGFFALAIALALVTGGLFSSVFHLGRPERAPRAFSQWKTSWLSREAVAATATYVPAAILGIGWVILGSDNAIVGGAGILAAIGALVTLVTTGMIYASLKPIPQWSSPYTVPGYILYALMTGATLLNALVLLAGADHSPVAFLAPLLVFAGWIFKNAAWRHNDQLAMPTSAASATGLKGTVRSVEWPHTEENYLMKEMGYRVARKHAEKLRLFVHAAAFAVPLALTLLSAVTGGTFAVAAACLAALVQVPGILTERWLFFAEAKHTVSLYYGR